MKIAIICGNQREGESQKVMKTISKKLNFLSISVITTIDLNKENIPLWNQEVWEKKDSWNKNWTNISKKLSSTDGIIIICPEYGGMVPPSLKNFFLLCSKGEIAHKPGLIVSISSGRNGVYPISELRMSSYKNTKICYIPDHLIIRDVKEFNNDGSEDFEYINKRIDNSILTFLAYTKGFISIRKNQTVKENLFKYGM